MNDEKAVYLLLGIENQLTVHYAAPVKNLLYDALQYAAQVERRAKIHLLAPSDLSLEDLKRFRSSLGDVLHFIKYTKDKTHMKS